MLSFQPILGGLLFFISKYIFVLWQILLTMLSFASFLQLLLAIWPYLAQKEINWVLFYCMEELSVFCHSCCSATSPSRVPSRDSNSEPTLWQAHTSTLRHTPMSQATPQYELFFTTLPNELRHTPMSHTTPIEQCHTLINYILWGTPKSL